MKQIVTARKLVWLLLDKVDFKVESTTEDENWEGVQFTGPSPAPIAPRLFSKQLLGELSLHIKGRVNISLRN